jgi:hypothetical protein
MVDVEIYMNNIIKFFRENPTDLLNLVPKDKEEYFYTKIKKVAIENYEKGEDVSLTQSQLISLINRCLKKFQKILFKKRNLVIFF